MGTAKQVANKIAMIVQKLGLTRFIAHMDIGGPDHDDMLHSIDIYARDVIPALSNYLATTKQ